MRVERIGNDKIKIFLTTDDLSEWGIKKEDLLSDVPKVHDLFNEIMDQAYEELGFELSGPVAVEIFALPAQGMVVIVSGGKQQFWNDEDIDNDMVSLEVTLEESDSIIYAFKDFEDLLMASKRINPYLMYGGIIYSYKGHYVLVFDEMDVSNHAVDNIIAVLSEYGEASPISKIVLEEYGKIVIEEDAVKVLVSYF